jgi:hypothetical protein
MIILLHIHPGIHCFDILFTSVITLDKGKVTHNRLVVGSNPVGPTFHHFSCAVDVLTALFLFLPWFEIHRV